MKLTNDNITAFSNITYIKATGIDNILKVLPDVGLLNNSGIYQSLWTSIELPVDILINITENNIKDITDDEYTELSNLCLTLQESKDMLSNIPDVESEDSIYNAFGNIIETIKELKN